MKLTRCFSVYLVVVLFAAVVAADWSDTYADDFSTNKAESDSYRHSTFWPKQAVPLAEPYLSYLRVNGDPGLAFTEYKGRLAEVGYRFPLGPVTARRVIKGVLTVDVSFPTGEFSQIPAGRLLYAVSPDGIGWSPAEPLEEGRREIPISSPDGACYVLFTGTKAAIDDLSVSLYSAPVTFRVPTDFGTIQEAIDAAADGDVIEVAKGTYSGPDNRDLDFQGKAITVRSEEGPQVTTIDCGGLAAVDGGHRGFYFHSGEGADSVVSGFTIVGGRIFGSEIPPDPLRWTNDPAHPIGGGIYCEFSSPRIADCIVRDCGAELGGGIGVVGGDPMISDCTIEQCIAGGLSTPKAGGRGAGVGLIGFSNVTLTNCLVRNNSAYDNSSGAGLYVWQSAAVVAGCTFSGNNAPRSLRGGGAYCGGTGTDVTFQNCIFSCNQADAGAGLLAEQGRVSVINCTVAQNELASASASAAGGIQTTGTDILINSSILWGNTGRTLALTNPLSKNPVIYSDVQGGYAGPGNLSLDPCFAALNSEDYHLKSKYGRYDPLFSRWVNDNVHSSCIDAGDPTLSVGEEPGPNGGRINMGAYGGTRQASNGTQRFVYHVDASGGSNYNTGRSRETAFATIQKGIDTAQDGDTVLVWPGVYSEELFFNGKAIRVQSAADAAVLTTPPGPREGYAVSFCFGEGSRSVLANFVIAGCGGEGAVYCDGRVSPSLKNLTIAGNKFGIKAYKGADPNIINCILWGNDDGDLYDCTARYSDIQSRAADWYAGNSSADPLFADPQKGDYHLKSQAGRYVFPWDTWVTDSQTSPCIDAGDPREDPRGELMPNGDRVNMGAYGGTPFASKSG